MNILISIFKYPGIIGVWDKLQHSVCSIFRSPFWKFLN